MRVYFALGLIVAFIGCDASEYGNRGNKYGIVSDSNMYAVCKKNRGIIRVVWKASRFIRFF